MRQHSKLSKKLALVRWVLAFIGFAVIVFSGKMTHYIFYLEYDTISLSISLGIGLLFMAPLVLYIIKERQRQS